MPNAAGDEGLNRDKRAGRACMAGDSGGAGISENPQVIRKNPAKQDSPPAAGRISDMIPFRRSAIPRRGFLLYRNHSFHTLM